VAFAGSSAAHFKTCGCNSKQCGQAYEKNSMTSTLSGVDAACGGVNSS
jgi:hypothetical protein